MLQDIGFDGFTNIECCGGTIKRDEIYFSDLAEKHPDDLKGFSGIGVFDESNLRFDNQYYGWNEIKTLPEVEAARKLAKAYIPGLILESMN